MHTSRLISKVALAGMAGWAVTRMLRGRRRRGDDLVRVRIPAADPRDPVQGFDDVVTLHDEDLAVDAYDAADISRDLDIARFESASDEAALAEAEALGLLSRPWPVSDSLEANEHDVGELYGVHMPAAEAGVGSEEDDEDGEHWLDRLEASAVENGALPEHEIDVEDDDPSDPRAGGRRGGRGGPVADKGSGGPAGA